MFNDLKNRHQIESKTTNQFLHYALGHRSEKPAKNLIFDKSVTASMQGLDMSYDRTQLPVLTRRKSTDYQSSVASTIKHYRDLNKSDYTPDSQMKQIKLPHLMSKQERNGSEEQKKTCKKNLLHQYKPY